jgi:hypothetical protein
MNDEANERMTQTAKKPSASCLTCYGTGEVVTEIGATACPDCYGNGKPMGHGTTLEWRLRDLERAHRAAGESSADILWLVHELRKSRDTLVRIVTRCEDETSSELAMDVKHIANEVLGLYDLKPRQ